LYRGSTILKEDADAVAIEMLDAELHRVQRCGLKELRAHILSKRRQKKTEVITRTICDDFSDESEHVQCPEGCEWHRGAAATDWSKDVKE
jgi:hypothetical protein